MSRSKLHPYLASLLQQIRSLLLATKLRLLQELQALIDQEQKTEEVPTQTGREIVKEQRIGQTVYRQERIRYISPILS